MAPRPGPERLSFLGRPPPAPFTRRVVRIEPGCSLPYMRADWEDALVVVEAGVVDVECRRGGCRTFTAGAVVFMVGLDLAAMHNRGTEAVVLSAVSRGPP